MGAQRLRGNVRESEAGECLGERIACTTFRCAGQQLPHGEQSGEEEHHGHSTDHDEHGRQFHIPDRDAEDPCRRDQNRQGQHRDDGDQRRRRDGETDGQQIDEEDDGPDQDGDGGELEERNQNEQQCEWREQMRPPERRRGGTEPLLHDGEDAVKHGEHEHESQSPEEECVADVMHRPSRDEQMRERATEKLQRSQLRLAQREREQTEVRTQHESSEQAGTLAERLVAQEKQRIHERQQRETCRSAVEPLVGLLAAMGDLIAREKQRVETQQHDHRGDDLVHGEELLRPAQLHPGGAKRGERDEEMPAFRQGHGDQSGVEQRDVSEQADRVVHSRREQHGREESTQHAEDGDDHGVQSNGDRESCRCDQHHEQEGRQRSEEREVIHGATGKRDRVEHDHAGGAERVRRDGVLALLQQHAAHDQAEAGKETHRDAHFGRDEIALERILHEVTHRKEQREPSEPREELHAHELFPVDLRPLGTGWRRGGRSPDGLRGHQRRQWRRSGCHQRRCFVGLSEGGGRHCRHCFVLRGNRHQKIRNHRPGVSRRRGRCLRVAGSRLCWRRCRMLIALQLTQFEFKRRESVLKILGVANSPPRPDERRDRENDDASDQHENNQYDQAFHDSLAASELTERDRSVSVKLQIHQRKSEAWKSS